MKEIFQKYYTYGVKVSGWIRKVPDQVVEYVSFFAIFLLATLPVTAPIEGYWKHKLDFSFMWRDHILRIGWLGILISIICFIKFRGRPKKEKENFIKKHFVLICFFLLLVWSFVSYKLCQNQVTALFGDVFRKEGIMMYFAYAGIFIMTLSITKIRLNRILMEVMVIFSNLLAVAVLLNNSGLNKKFCIDRLQATFYNPNHFGYYLAIMILLVVNLWITDVVRVKWKKIVVSAVRLVQMVLLFNAMALCYSLGPMIAVTVALIAFSILSFWKERKKVIPLCLCSLLFLAVVLKFNSITPDVETFNDQLVEVTKEVELLTEGIEKVPHFGSGRMEIWKLGIQFIKENPVFGLGPDNLRESYTKAGSLIDRPHNEPIQIAASLGIPALIFYFSALAGVLVLFIITFQKLTLLEVGLFCAVGAYLISSLVGNTMFYTTPYFYIVLAMAYGSAKRKHYNI